MTLFEILMGVSLIGGICLLIMAPDLLFLGTILAIRGAHRLITGPNPRPLFAWLLPIIYIVVTMLLSLFYAGGSQWAGVSIGLISLPAAALFSPLSRSGISYPLCAAIVAVLAVIQYAALGWGLDRISSGVRPPPWDCPVCGASVRDSRDRRCSECGARF